MKLCFLSEREINSESLRQLLFHISMARYDSVLMLSKRLVMFITHMQLPTQ